MWLFQAAGKQLPKGCLPAEGSSEPSKCCRHGLHVDARVDRKVKHWLGGRLLRGWRDGCSNEEAGRNCEMELSSDMLQSPGGA